MTPKAVRAVVLAVFVAGTAGMIASSVAGSNGWALASGLLTAAAAVCLITVTATSGGEAVDAEAAGTALEERIARLVGAGADEAEVRALVAEAVRLGRRGT